MSEAPAPAAAAAEPGVDKKITLIRVKRKRCVDTPEDLVVEGVANPRSKRPHVSLSEQLGALDVAAQPPEGGAAGRQRKRRRFQRVTTLSAAQVSSLSEPALQELLAARRRGARAVPAAAAGAAKQAAALQRVRSAARYEQVVRRRGLTNFERTEAAVDPLREWSHVYDVVCQAEEEEEAGPAGGAGRAGRSRGRPQYDEGTLLCNYLPMVREYLASQGRELAPTPEERCAAAAGDAAPAGDDEAMASEYVYDLYAMASEDDEEEGAEGGEEGDAAVAAAGRQECWEAHTRGRAPVVQIVDDDTWLVLERSDEDDSDAISDDSNAEGFYAHDYPDEQSSDSDSDGYGYGGRGARGGRAAGSGSESGSGSGSGSESEGGRDRRIFY